MSKPVQLQLRYIRRQTMILTAAAYTLSAFRYGGMRLLNCQNAAGQAFTLPPATGKAGKYRFYIGTTLATGNTVIRTGNSGADVMNGFANVQASAFSTASNTNTITLNGTTQGGIAGSYFEVEDVAKGQWRVNYDGIGSGSIVTPFSNT